MAGMHFLERSGDYQTIPTKTLVTKVKSVVSEQIQDLKPITDIDNTRTCSFLPPVDSSCALPPVDSS